MKRTLISFVGALAFTAGLAGVSHAQRGGTPSATCRPSNQAVEFTLAALQRLVTSTDTVLVASRHRRQLPAVAASQVSYVTDDAICAKAEKPYTAAVPAKTPPVTPSLQVYVFKVGNVYVIWDPVQTVGEFTNAMTLSNNFKVIAKYTM